MCTKLCTKFSSRDFALGKLENLSKSPVFPRIALSCGTGAILAHDLAVSVIASLQNQVPAPVGTLPVLGDEAMDADLSNPRSIAARVEKLEKQNWLFKRCGLLLLLSASALVVMGQARPPRIIEAQTFILKDAKGYIRAELNTSTRARPAIRSSFFTRGAKTTLWGRLS